MVVQCLKQKSSTYIDRLLDETASPAVDRGSGLTHESGRSDLSQKEGDELDSNEQLGQQCQVESICIIYHTLNSTLPSTIRVASSFSGCWEENQLKFRKGKD